MRSDAGGDLTRAEQDAEDVGDGEGEKEPPEAWRRIDLEAQAAHTEVGLPVAEGQFDVHPLAVELDDVLRGKQLFGTGGDEEEPRLLEAGVVEDDDVDWFAGGVLIGDVWYAAGSAGATGQAAEAEPRLPTRARWCCCVHGGRRGCSAYAAA